MVTAEQATSARRSGPPLTDSLPRRPAGLSPPLPKQAMKRARSSEVFLGGRVRAHSLAPLLAAAAFSYLRGQVDDPAPRAPAGAAGGGVSGYGRITGEILRRNEAGGGEQLRWGRLANSTELERMAAQAWAVLAAGFSIWGKGRPAASGSIWRNGAASALGDRRDRVSSVGDPSFASYVEADSPWFPRTTSNWGKICNARTTTKRGQREYYFSTSVAG